MLRTLESNQPIAWLAVPLSSVLVLSVWAGISGNFNAAEICREFGVSWLILIATVRAIHIAHMSSGMSDRPTALPSWTAAVVGTVLLAQGAQQEVVTGLFAVVFSMRLALMVRSEQLATGLMFAASFIAGTASLFDFSFVWGVPALLAGMAHMMRLRPATIMAWAMGALTPWWIAAAVWWLWRGPEAWVMLLDTVPDLRIFSLEPLALWPFWLALFWATVGLVIRTQKLSTATAQSRRTRMMTSTWSAVALAAAWAFHPDHTPCGWFVLFAAWNVPATIPREKYWGSAALWALLVLAAMATLL
jgi:hypothetical protein